MTYIKRMINWIKYSFLKFFKRQQGLSESNKNTNTKFIQNVQKLNRKGMINIYKGGMQALENELYKKNQIVYIMVIQEIKKDSEKSINFKQWFKNL